MNRKLYKVLVNGAIATIAGVLAGISLPRELFVGDEDETRSRRRGRSPQKKPDVTPLPTEIVSSPLSMHAPLQPTFRRVSDHLITEYDTSRKSPRWSLEHVTPETLQKQADRNKLVFKEDSGIPELWRVKLADYEGSGYDRGHLAPAANHRHCSASMAETFYLTNVVPQVGVGHNRDYWARLESMIRGWVGQYPNVYIVTAPVWLPKRSADNLTVDLPLTSADDVTPSTEPTLTKTIPHLPITSANDVTPSTEPTPPKTIPPATSCMNGKWTFSYSSIGSGWFSAAVPTHLCKVVLLADAENHPKALGAFLVPNTVINAEEDVRHFVVPVVALEHALGFSVFPGLKVTEKVMLDAINKDEVVKDGTATSLEPWRNYARMLGLTNYNNPMSPPTSATGMETASRRQLLHLCEVADCALPPVNWFQLREQQNSSVHTAP